jgi:serine/threonine-protein kinase
VDIRADIYSLGATLYYLLAGRPLFPEGRTAQKLVWQQIKEASPIDRLRPDVPPELSEVIHRMLRKKPVDRYQTPAEVFDALTPFVPDEMPPPDPAWLPEPPARVAVSRTVMPGPAAPRVSGSTSQILAAAMRTGGSGPRRALPSTADLSGVSSSGSSQLSIIPSGTRPDDGNSPTHAMAIDDTQRTPEPEPRVATAPRPGSWQVNQTIVIVILATALALALVEIAVLLLR